MFACNFANHMFAVGQQLLQEYGLPADLIKPLIRETVAKALDSPSAAAVQTGPARRNDYRTRHIGSNGYTIRTTAPHENITRWKLQKHMRRALY